MHSMKSFAMAALCAAALLATVCTATAAVPNGDYGAIADYDTTYFLNTFKSLGKLKWAWKGSDACQYPGVLCDISEQLVSIMLPGADLSGQIPSFGRDATFNPGNVRVASINLMDNSKITGAFPAHYGRLLRLRELVLKGTGLKGTIPPTWNNLHALVSVDLSNTGACRDMPNWDRISMPALQYVNLDGNKYLRGTLSSSFGSFSGRSITLKLNDTQFCNCVPPSYDSDLQAQVAKYLPQAVAPTCAKGNCTEMSQGCFSVDAAAHMSAGVRAWALVSVVAAALAVAM